MHTRNEREMNELEKRGNVHHKISAIFVLPGFESITVELFFNIIDAMNETNPIRHQ